MGAIVFRSVPKGLLRLSISEAPWARRLQFQSKIQHSQHPQRSSGSSGEANIYEGKWRHLPSVPCCCCYCRGYAARALLQELGCRGYAAGATLQGLWCRGSAARAMLHGTRLRVSPFLH